MPYASNAGLPASVRNNLPSAAQTIYRKAFNAALKQYKSEERAAKVAWAAVKNVYKKVGDKWQKKTEISGDIIYTDSIEIKSVDGNMYVRGYLSTSDLDLVDDIVSPHCLQSIAKQIKDSGMTFKIGKDHEHILEDSRNLPIGKITDSMFDNKGLMIEVMLNKFHPGYDSVKGSLENGFLDAFSIEFEPLNYRYEFMDGKRIRILDDLNFGGAAFTGRPANPNCTITDMFIKSKAINEILKDNMEVESMKDIKQEPAAQEQPKEEEKIEKPTEEPSETSQPETQEATPEEKVEEKPAEEPKTEEPAEEKPATDEVKALARELIQEVLKEEIKALKQELKSVKPESRVLVSNESKFEQKATPFNAMAAWKQMKGVN